MQLEKKEGKIEGRKGQTLEEYLDYKWAAFFNKAKPAYQINSADPYHGTDTSHYLCYTASRSCIKSRNRCAAKEDGTTYSTSNSLRNKNNCFELVML